MPRNNKIRVALDTNLWISYLISKRLKSIDKLFKQGHLIIIFSTELLEEFIEVTSQSKFEKYFAKEDINKLLKLFNVYGELIEVTSTVKACQDPKDNFLLALSKDSELDFLITGDTDLLILKHFGKTKIITYKEFESLDL